MVVIIRMIIFMCNWGIGTRVNETGEWKKANDIVVEVKRFSANHNQTSVRIEREDRSPVQMS